ncbi:LD-carboxypeptidase [Pelistega europaea]|uniref:LD-carboxypeptidase n=1 Tax=Pelistega europaea TaxID=106147 RepID=A0A7Y4LC18_9BURK|nr:LD-carboxypeptidase [Pelistega europaea]NOL49672.1 LD-carboxypeptidase [Pelistega europaea]
MSTNQRKAGNHQLEQRVNDAQILFDEADDVPVVKEPYAEKLGLYLISPSGAIADPKRLPIAQKKLSSLGFDVRVDKAAAGKYLRFAATDEERAKAFSRAAKDDAPIVMATRGGYGISRILPLIDWKLLEKNPKTYVGYSDFTAFNLALLAKTGLPSFTGPNAVGDFSANKVDDLIADIFVESMRGELEILSFETQDADEVDTEGVLWGGNLAMLTSLVGTPYLPKIKKGILFFEDVSEHPYRIERLLTQLLHAGILDKQKAIIIGDITDYELSKSDNGFNMAEVIKWLRSQIKVPVITGLPYGHGEMRVTLPIGKKVGIATEKGMAYLLLDKHDHNHADHSEHEGHDGHDCIECCKNLVSKKHKKSKKGKKAKK